VHCKILICKFYYSSTFADLDLRFTQAHYRQAGIAVAAGLVLYLVLLLPLFLIRATVWTSSLFVDLNRTKWDDGLIDGGWKRCLV